MASRVHDGKTQLWNRWDMLDVRSRLATVSKKHDQLIAQILSVSHLQCAWILLLFCARPKYMSRWSSSEVRGNSCLHHSGMSSDSPFLEEVWGA